MFDSATHIDELFERADQLMSFMSPEDAATHLLAQNVPSEFVFLVIKAAGVRPEPRFGGWRKV